MPHPMLVMLASLTQSSSVSKDSLGSQQNGRDEFSRTTKELLAKRAGFRCSICQKPTVGPHSDAGQSIYLGEASHIYSAAPNGPRANQNLTSEERSAHTNGIHLCKLHGRLVDLDESEYTVEKLHCIKEAHVQKIRNECGWEIDGLYDPHFLSGHETQIIHKRGAPTLTETWVQRHVSQPHVKSGIVKRDIASILTTESGIVILTGDQSSGRTSALKRLVSDSITKKCCIWLKGEDLTESEIKDPIRCLSRGHKRIHQTTDGQDDLLEAPDNRTLIVVEDLHRSSVNHATKRKFLSLLSSLSSLVIVTLGDAFFLELCAISQNDGLKITQWRIGELSRTDCADMAAQWCRFGADTTPDHELDARIASTQEQLEILFGRKLMPRHPVYVLTALQLIDVGTPMNTHVGSFGGVYETIIHFAISKNARSPAEISSERSYLQELAFCNESYRDDITRTEFNQWFSKFKDITLKKTLELEFAVIEKGFLSRDHCGFRFNYQKCYFLAAFLRDNQQREGVKAYISRLVVECWNEDFANTALFLAYLQPSSFLTEALLAEINGLFSDQSRFDFSTWTIETPFPVGFFRGLSFTTDPESNRRKLAERLDETSPLDSSECDAFDGTSQNEEHDCRLTDYLKGHHAIRLIGQLIRNSPIAFNADQKGELVRAGFDLSLRLVSFAQEICGPAALQNAALSGLQGKVLKQNDRAEIEAKLSGLIYSLSVFLAFSPIRHACHFLAHPDLELTYKRVLQKGPDDHERTTLALLECGLDFELRSPNIERLRKAYKDLPLASQDILHLWTSIFLNFNRVPVSKRQAILDSVDMSHSRQLLRPNG